MNTNNLIQKKREDFSIQIRKERREEIFKRKRITVQDTNENQTNNYTPEERMQYIYQSYMEEDFKQLGKQLKQYSNVLIGLITQMTNSSLNENTSQTLYQFIQQIKTQKNSIFIDLLRMGDVPKEYNVQSARVDCVNQTLVIIINFTFLDQQNIIPILLQLDILSILLDDILGRIVQKEKLYVNNFEKWSLVFENIAQILINIILDRENPNVLETKKIILESCFFKIWQHIYTKNLSSQSWRTVIQLEQLLFREPSIRLLESSSQNTIKIIQQCTKLIELTELEDSLYQKVLSLLFDLSDYQVAMTLTLTKNIWETIIKNNKFPILYFSIFINFTSLRTEDYLTEQHLIKIKVIENMLFYLQNDNQEAMILVKIYKLLNNMLSFNSKYLVECCFQYFIPYLDAYIKRLSPIQNELVQEYTLVIRNLIVCQNLDRDYLDILFLRIDIMETLQIMQLNILKRLLNNGQSIFYMLAQLFGYGFDKLPLEYKFIILMKISQYQFIEIINKIVSQIEQDDVGCLDNLFELLQNWEADTNYMVQS